MYKCQQKILPTEIHQFQTNPVFFNENIRIGNKTIYNKSCIENGIKYINDTTKEDGNIYTYDELKITYNVNISFFKIFRSGQVGPALEENIKLTEHKK